MPANINRPDLYASWAIVRTIELQKVSSWILAGMLSDLRGLQDEIYSLLLENDPAGATSTRAQLALLEAWLLAVEKKIKAVMDELADRAEECFEELADVQDRDEREALFIIFGIKLSAGDLAGFADLLIIGSTARQWFQHMGHTMLFKLRAAGQHAILGSQAAEDLRDAVRGDLNPFKIAQRETELVIRTGVDALPTEILKGIQENNPEPTKAPPRTGGEEEPAPEPVKFNPGWQQISVLDNRTSEICRNYAWKKWDYDYRPIGHALPFNGGPPRHPYCRSRIVLIELDAEETSERTFKEWIETRTDAANIKLFGETKFRMWESGLISDTELIRQPESEMSISDLRERGEMPKKP